MNTINVNNTIENYLSGSANRAEEAWILGELKDNPELAREVELRRKTNQILADRNILELRSRLEVIEMKKRSGGALRKNALKASKYAAVLAFLALLSSALFFSLRNVSTEKLYDKYHQPYEISSAVRSVNSGENTLMSDAITAYQEKDFARAIDYLEEVLAAEQSNPESMFMYGIANMEVSNYPVAGKSFSKVLEHNNNLYLEDAAWYLGLSYMMNNETDKALKQFRSIADSQSRYSRDARRLVRKLN